MPPLFIYINGYPGVGKFTIAKELSKLIERSKVIHNHIFIDPVASVFERSMSEYQPLRRLIRKEILRSIATSVSTKEITWIFTDQQSSSVNGSLAAQDYRDAAALRESLFIPVVLRCGLDENIRRVGSSGRGGQMNTKLTDVGILQMIRETEDLYSFGGDAFELDITRLSASQAAGRIHEHIENLTPVTCPVPMPNSR